MVVTYKQEVLDFIGSLEGKNLEITQNLLQLIVEIGIDVEARYYNKIIVLHKDGIDILGLSPRKAKYSLYVLNAEAKQRFLSQLGKIDYGVSCLRFGKWTDINPPGMRAMFRYLLENPMNTYGNFSS